MCVCVCGVRWEGPRACGRPSACCKRLRAAPCHAPVAFCGTRLPVGSRVASLGAPSPSKSTLAAAATAAGFPPEGPRWVTPPELLSNLHPSCCRRSGCWVMRPLRSWTAVGPRCASQSWGWRGWGRRRAGLSRCVKCSSSGSGVNSLAVVYCSPVLLLAAARHSAAVVSAAAKNREGRQKRSSVKPAVPAAAPASWRPSPASPCKHPGMRGMLCLCHCCFSVVGEEGAHGAPGDPASAGAQGHEAAAARCGAQRQRSGPQRRWRRCFRRRAGRGGRGACAARRGRLGSAGTG